MRWRREVPINMCVCVPVSIAIDSLLAVVMRLISGSGGSSLVVALTCCG